MEHSPRNRSLISGIAQAFIKAALQLCKHDTLRFQWMRYLPRKGDRDRLRGLWGSLVDQISRLLDDTPILVTRSGKSLNTIGNLRQITSDSVDEHGEPLFPDIEPEIYLSRRYEEHDIRLLSEYGLHKHEFDHILARVEADIAKSRSLSRMKASKPDSDWHGRAAALLNLPWERGWPPKYNQRLQAMPLVPVNDEEPVHWLSAYAACIYDAKTSGMDIPRGLGLNLLNHAASVQPIRMKFFRNLGVKEASIEFVRGRILPSYSHTSVVWEPSPVTTVQDSLERLRFLYLSHHLRLSGERSGKGLVVYTTEGKEPIRPADHAVYIVDEDPCGPFELLRAMPGGAPGLEERYFLNVAYLDNPPARPEAQELKWVEWLCTYVKIRRRMPIVESRAVSGINATSLSAECRYIAHHRPEMLLQFLLAQWNNDGAVVKGQESLLQEIHGFRVPCAGGQLYTLAGCYFPIEEFRNIARRYLLDSEFFPWIEIRTSSELELLPSQWATLFQDLQLHSVRAENINRMAFACELLNRLLDANTDASNIENPERVLGLYDYLLRSSREGRDRQEGISVVK